MAALDCQVSLLHIEQKPNIQRSRSPRSAQRLSMEVEERPSALGVRAPIIGYEVIEQREKFTVK